MAPSPEHYPSGCSGYGPIPQSTITGRVVTVIRRQWATTIRSPQTFVANGLAPPDRRLSSLVLVSALISAGILGLLILTVAGIIRFAIRRSRARRDRRPGYSPYGTMAG